MKLTEKDKWMWTQIKNASMTSGKDEVEASIFATDVLRLMARGKSEIIAALQFLAAPKA